MAALEHFPSRQIQQVAHIARRQPALRWLRLALAELVQVHSADIGFAAAVEAIAAAGAPCAALMFGIHLVIAHRAKGKDKPRVSVKWLESLRHSVARKPASHKA